MLLTRDDIKQLTGTPRKARQIEWLRSRGWVFELDWSGWPVVAVAEFEARMTRGKARRRMDGPDLEAMDAA